MLPAHPHPPDGSGQRSTSGPAALLWSSGPSELFGAKKKDFGPKILRWGVLTS